MVRTLLVLLLATSIVGCATRSQRIAAAVTGGALTVGGAALLYSASLPCESTGPYDLHCGIDKQVYGAGGALMLIGGLIALGAAVVHSQDDAGRAPSPR